MSHRLLLAFVGLVLLALVLPVPVRGQASAEGPLVVTRGEAVVTEPADRAWLTFGVEVRHGQATEARARAAADMTALREALAGAGVPDSAITTRAISLMPEVNYEDGRGEIRGYVARNRIEVELDDLDRLAAVIDAGDARREAGLSISGPRFGLQDEEGARRQALRQAVEVARGRAEALAAGAGRQLGAILRVEDQPQSVLPQPELMMMRAAPADGSVPTPVTPGEVEVRAVVTLTAELH